MTDQTQTEPQDVAYVDATFTVTGPRLTDEESAGLADAFEAWCASVGRDPVVMATHPTAVNHNARAALAAHPAPVVSDLLPAESIALTVALAQVQRGDDPSPNVAGMCVLALARLAGRHDWTVADAPAADDEGGQER